ncbi:RNA-directed DNA polymerase, eukaryota, reverse transcriptase zinc-binding domain protein [Tanacetum coccineum]
MMKEKEECVLESMDEEYKSDIWPKLKQDVIDVMESGCYSSTTVCIDWSLAQVYFFYKFFLKYGMDHNVEDNDVATEDGGMTSDMRDDDVELVARSINNRGLLRLRLYPMFKAFSWNVRGLNNDPNRKQVGDKFVKHFQSVLGDSRKVEPIVDPDSLFCKRLSDEDYEFMVRLVTNEEIKVVIFAMNDDKAPGPDGFSSKFFKTSWPIIGNEVCVAIRDFFKNGRLLKEVNATIIALVLKIKGCLGKIIDECQNAFIPSRQITYNVLLTHELMRNYHRNRGPSNVAFKIDIHKAYDYVEWEFMEQCLIHFGFHKSMIAWIMSCLSSPSFSINVNGNCHGYFKGMRGLRQGDPLSPYLFTLVMEVFSLMVRVLSSALKKFSGVSGLVPNLDKSLIFFGNVPESLKSAILNILPLAVGVLPASTFILPKAVNSEIEQLMRGFLWSHGDLCKGHAKVKWKDVCCLKCQGGLVSMPKVSWHKLVWFSQNIPTHAFILWLVIKQRSKTQDIIEVWQGNQDVKCSLCEFGSESHSQLFLECQSSLEVWSFFKELVKLSFAPNSLADIVSYLADRPINRDNVRLRILSLKIRSSRQAMEAAELWDVGLDKCNGALVRRILFFLCAGMRSKPRPFKFANFLANKVEFLLIVKEVWDSHILGHAMFSVVSKLKLLKNSFRKLRYAQGDLAKKVSETRHELERVQTMMVNDSHNSVLRNKEMACLKAYKDAMKDEESMNIIESVEDMNGTVFASQHVGVQFVKHFQSVFGESQKVVPFVDQDSLFSKRFSNEDAEFMVRPVSNDEIKAVVFGMNDEKSPGPDGFSSKFFKSYWPIIGNEVSGAICDFFKNGRLLKEVNATIIAFVPKSQTSQNVSDFRPISCCNVLCKVITKIIANRIKGCLGKIVDESQNAFIPPRQITDNVLLTHELMRNYHRSRGPSKVAFKIDIHKAYDSVFSLMVKRRIIEDGDFKYHWRCDRLKFTHLSFVDDLMVFSRADVHSVMILSNALSEFNSVSGLVPNLEKSSIFFGNFPDHLKSAILNVLPLVVGILPVRYLVLSSLLGFINTIVVV